MASTFIHAILPNVALAYISETLTLKCSVKFSADVNAKFMQLTLSRNGPVVQGGVDRNFVTNYSTTPEGGIRQDILVVDPDFNNFYDWAQKNFGIAPTFSWTLTSPAHPTLIDLPSTVVSASLDHRDYEGDPSDNIPNLNRLKIVRPDPTNFKNMKVEGTVLVNPAISLQGDCVAYWYNVAICQDGSLEQCVPKEKLLFSTDQFGKIQ